MRPCTNCGNLDTTDPCAICRDPKRDDGAICVVEDVADLWAIERTHAFAGRYHVLGGTLSALDGIGPEELNIDTLLQRAGATQKRDDHRAQRHGRGPDHGALSRGPRASTGVASRVWRTACRSAASSTTSTKGR